MSTELTTLPVFDAALSALGRYHSHRVEGLASVPSGPAIVVFNHSFATYDAWIGGVAIYKATGRLPRPLFDRLFFRFPGIGGVVRRAGVVEGTRENAVRILREGAMIAVAPGGMREGLLLRRKRYQIDWKGRFGFVWLSLLSGAPIVLAACPRADDIYDAYPNPITQLAYAKFKVPVPVASGWGGTLFPRPIALTHVLSEPIASPVTPEDADQAAVEAHHGYVTRRMEQLMEDAMTFSSNR